MRRRIAIAIGFAAVGLAAGCGGALPIAGSPADSDDAAAAPEEEDRTPDQVPDAGLGGDGGAPVLAAGGAARVIAIALNLRAGAGTGHAILDVMSCGDALTLLAGPSGYWWQVDRRGTVGWASGNYLVPAAAFDPTVCGVEPTPGNDPGGILERARLGVGYSYWWGHGSWRGDGTSPGACMGDCPQCSHTGPFGADCSGYVAKAWQVPAPSALTKDLHPYSTHDFFHRATDWSPLPRSGIEPGDALVYNANGSGHILIFEAGADPWGSVWAYEARGCATGIVHDLRAVSSSYVAIRRRPP